MTDRYNRSSTSSHAMREGFFKRDLDDANRLLSKGELDKALDLFNRVLDQDPLNVDAQAGFRCCRFWVNRNIDNQTRIFKASHFQQLIAYWEEFEDFALRYDLVELGSYKAILFFIHRKLTRLIPTAGQMQGLMENDIDTITKIGELFIVFGDWANARELLEVSRSLKRDDPRILALLGESYIQSNNIQRGLAMMREAFYINPDKIPMHLLRCKPVVKVIEELKAAGIQRQHWPEWFPVFGSLFNIFQVQRSLPLNQLEELKRNTLQLEEAYQDNDDHTIILPRLLNHYLWLLDYYMIQDENKAFVDEIFLRLRSLDKRVYEILFDSYGL